MANITPETEDDKGFYHAVASEIGQGHLTLAQEEIAFTARCVATESYERMGPTIPTSGHGLVYQIAWLITQKRLRNPE